MYRHKNANPLVEYIKVNTGSCIMGFIVVSLCIAWLVLGIIPEYRAKAYLDSNNLNFFTAYNQGIINMLDSAMGYKLYSAINTADGLIKEFDLVDIYSMDGKKVATGQYEGFYAAPINLNLGYHIVIVYAPGRKLFEKEYKIDSSKVVLYRSVEALE